jgi:lysozyme
MYTVQGTDVSIWQDDISTPQHIDFTKMIDSGAKFTFIKASQATYLDRDYAINSENARLAGIPRGFYHYVDWTKPMLDQARFFAGVLHNDPGELPAVLDCEQQSGAPIDSANQFKIFCEEFLRITGKRVMIYTSYGYWGEHGSVNPYWRDYKLWVANYTSAPQPAFPKPWNSWTFWQYTSQGDGPYWGAEEKYIDLNWYKGTEQEFNVEFNIQSGSPIPPIPPVETKYLDGLVIATAGVNVRTGPGTSYPVVRVAPYNAPLKIINTYAPQTNWVQLDDKNWAAMTYNTEKIIKI